MNLNIIKRSLFHLILILIFIIISESSLKITFSSTIIIISFFFYFFFFSYISFILRFIFHNFFFFFNNFFSNFFFNICFISFWFILIITRCRGILSYFSTYKFIVVKGFLFFNCSFFNFNSYIISLMLSSNSSFSYFSNCS